MWRFSVHRGQSRARWWAVGLAAVLAAGVSGPVLARAEADPVRPAAGTGPVVRRTEVLSQRSETREVYAEPDGTFTAEIHAQPVRARTAAGWAPIDTTLSVQPDGSVAPRAAVVSLRLSGGGTGTPLVSLAEDGKRLELSWPGPLPRPVLSGDSATYPEVLPGVDLKVVAEPQGYSELLIVKNRAAARNPELARLRFGLRTAGLTVRAGEHGSVRAVDAKGRTVFASAAPQAWDSGSRRATGRFELSAGGLAVVPEPGLLADPKAVYPIVIDPDFGRIGWLKVFSGYPGNSYWNGRGDDQDAKVGQCYHDSRQNFCGSPSIGTARTYFVYDTGFLIGRHVRSAEFNAFESWSSSCTPSWVEAWETHPVWDGVAWNGQPFFAGGDTDGAIGLGSYNVAYGHDSGCPARNLGWDAKAGVQREASAGSTVTTILLKAPNWQEGDMVTWKKFANNPSLVVNYNSYPDLPTNQTTNNQPCVTGAGRPYLGTTTPTFRESVTDPDGNFLDVFFAWAQLRADGSKIEPWPADHVGTASGTTAQFTTPPLLDGKSYAWRSQSNDGVPTDDGRGLDSSPTTGWCEFTVDVTPPNALPGVASTAYPENVFGGAVGLDGAFTFNPSGVPDLAGYWYSLVQAPNPSGQFVAAGTGGGATVRVTPTHDGPNDLWVWAVDRAGNPSPRKQYHFLVNPGSDPVAMWRIDGDGTTAVPDGSGNHHDGTVHGTTGWTVGRVADAMNFDGSTGYVSTVGGPAVDTSGSFSVAAWARLDRVGGYPAVVSEDGQHSAGFQLQATPDGHWAFAMFSADVDGGGDRHDRIVSTTPAQTGVWTHLVAVYDAGAGQIRLYVNGTLAASGAHPSAWRATGTVTIARSMWSSAPSDYWPGAIDQVEIYNRALSDVPTGKVGEIPDRSEIDRIATLPSNEEGFYPLDETAGTRATDVSGNYRTATVTGGYSWVPGHVGPGAVLLNGSTGYLATSAPAVRTDNSFTVTATVRLDEDTFYPAAVSQDGPRSSGFSLQYNSSRGAWTFALSPGDSDAPRWVETTSTQAARLGEWTHLAAVYDASTGQIRLYVNGQLAANPVPVPATMVNVSGGLAIGRNKLAGVLSRYWKGAIDDVHVYTGVRTQGQIRDEFLNPVVTPVTVYTGEFGRFVDHAGHHFVTTTGLVPPGYKFEGPMGLPAPDGAPNTRPLFSCRYPGGQFLDVDPACAGNEVLGQSGSVYVTAPPDVPTRPLYRCLVSATGDHFASFDPACEGKTAEFLLGYTRAYAYLIRYVQGDRPGDHWTAISNLYAPAGYRPEGVFGVVALYGGPGLQPLEMCLGTFGGWPDEFSSNQAPCESGTTIAWTGNVWTAEPAGVAASTELYQCTVDGSGERFDSTDPGCEGQAFVRSLGWLVTQL